MSFIKQALTLLAPLTLVACANLSNPPSATQPPTIALRNYQQTLDLGGRLSVRYQADLREEALHGSFTWEQQPAHTRVTLLSPLGQTVAVIEVTPQGATLVQGGQERRSASDVNALTAQTLGWPLPVAGLRDWLQGFVETTSGRQFASPEHNSLTSRDGWHILYTTWTDDASPRPRRIDLRRNTAQAGEVALRIVIDTWQTP